MDKFIDKWRSENSSAVSNSSTSGRTNSSGGGQQGQKRQIRIEDCKKVQVLECSYIAATPQTLEPIREGLEVAAATGDIEGQLLQLRKLACFELHYDVLVDSQIGPVVRQLRKSTHPEIARLACGVVEKLKEVVRRRARTATGDVQGYTAPVGNGASAAGSGGGGPQRNARSSSTLGPAPKRLATTRPTVSTSSSAASIPAAWRPGADGWMVRK